MKKINIGEYDIYFGEIWEAFSKKLEELNPSKVFYAFDTNTFKDCKPILIEKGYEIDKSNTLFIFDGEKHKLITSATSILRELLEKGADRDSLVVLVGGGIIGDVAGFAASIFMRGIRFIQMPTTILAAVDSSIGGKLGVDLRKHKNIIGSFQNPEAVFVYPKFFDTLDRRQKINGMAEAIKHALIGNKKQWKEILETEDLLSLDMVSFLSENLLVKRDLVLRDPFEKGHRKALNFGHTIGHAIESYFLGSDIELFHGEAVAAGMIAESYLSFKFGKIGEDEIEEINRLIKKYYTIPKINREDFTGLIELMKRDKKSIGGKINITFLNGIGGFSINNIIVEEDVIEALEYLF